MYVYIYVCMYIYFTVLISTFGYNSFSFMITIQGIEIYFIKNLLPNIHQSECVVTL